MDEEVERVFQETSEHYQNRMEHLAKENHDLKQQLIKRNKENKKLKRIISKKKKQDRQHYKNGFRGSNNARK